jgi:RNA ligase
MKQLTKRGVAPDFHRIPHFDKNISNMTHDDIVPDLPIDLPITCYVQEKIDGANMGISWLNDGPIVRNRENILKKGYSNIRTPSKKQFTSSWNWVHKHEKDIKEIEKNWMSPITIYGEWMFAKHSIEYDMLPDWFIAYDIWSVNDNRFLSPHIVESLLSKTKISYIKPEITTFNSINEIVSKSEMKSRYRNGIVEGIVLKTSKGEFLDKTWKIVNSKFERRDDFNSCLIKNKVISL